jgi:hypothetical protein
MESAVMLSPAKGWDGFEPLKARIESLEGDLQRRQESYIRRERAYKAR